MVAVGLNQSQLARAVGLKQPSIGRLISGETRETRKLLELAAMVKSTPAYLTGDSDDPGSAPGDLRDNRRTFVSAPQQSFSPEELGLVEVKEVNLELGLGGGYIDEGAILEISRWLPLSWLRELTRTDPAFLRIARTKGNSMKPTFSDGDFAILDLSQNSIREQDGLYAVAVAQIGMVKRIWANADGSYKIKSDNTNVGFETAHDNEMHVIGQVVGKIGKP